MKRTIKKVTSAFPELPTKLRVAAYARVSSGKDAMLQSLSAQVSYYSDLIQRHTDWEYAGVFADEAMTGTKDTRAEFQRLLTECEAGRIDLIITKSISRFARNTVTLLESIRSLKRHNVDVFFDRENIHSMSGDGELMLTILASFAQEESLSTSENCKWRIRKNFKEGRPNTLHLYGYDYLNGGLMVNVTEADVIRTIYSDYLDGMGKNAIMRKFMSMGVPTKDGGRWSEGAVDRILRNEKYTGNMLLQKTYSENHLTKAKRVNRGELPMYYVENSHESIIEQSVFEAVQAELAQRAKKYLPNPKTPMFSAFTSKIHCGICGSNFRKKTNNAGTKYAKVIWSCATFNSRGKAYCASKQIPEVMLKETITEVLGLATYDSTAFSANIRKINVPENGVLIFVFNNGTEVQRIWENKSRRESWTNEMREQARQTTLSRDKE